MSRKKPEPVYVTQQEEHPKAKHIQPMTENQGRLLKAIDEAPFTIAMGSAGTGKTYCAVSKAVNFLLQKKARKIILSRPNVPTGRSLGFFPGDIKEKLEPWLAPMLSVIKERMGTNWYDNQFRLGNLQIQPLETIRGASFENSVILIDEAQNLNTEEIKAISTRIGNNTKLVLMGDPDQRDLKQSDLSKMANLYEKSGLFIPVVRFTIDDIVRSDIVADLVRLYHKEGI